jgi:glucose uptake protein GlcU
MRIPKGEDMNAVIDGFTALMLLALAAVFGGVTHQIKEKSKDVTRVMFRASTIALVAGLGMVFIKYTSDKVVYILKDRWHLLAYGLILGVVAGLAFLYRNKKKSVPLVWAIIGLASGTGIVLHLFW